MTYISDPTREEAVKTVFGYDNLLDDSSVTVVASSTAEGSSVDNLNTDATYNYWQSDEGAS